MAGEQRDDDFSANLMNDANGFMPSQAPGMLNQFSIDERNVRQVSDRRLQSLQFPMPNSFQQSSSQLFFRPHNNARGLSKPIKIPAAADKERQLTCETFPASASFGPPRPPFLQYNSNTQNHDGGAGTMAHGSPSGTGSSFLAAPKPSVPAGTPSNDVSAKYMHLGFTFPATWQEFEQRGIQYFGIDGANLSSLSGQPPPPETARLVTPMDPGFPMSDISSTEWGDRQLRRIAFLPNTLRLDPRSLTGEIIYFLRQFGVSFDDMIARASNADLKVDWENHRKRLKERETQYRNKCKGGWARCFRVRNKGEITDDSKPRLIGPNAFTKEHFFFNVFWNVDVNSQTMWPRVGPSARHPLPPPTIDPKVEKMLENEGITVPDLNWLRAKYPSLSLAPAQSTVTHEGVRAKFSSNEEEKAQFPGSLNGLQNSGAAPNSLVTPAVWTSKPTSVIHSQLVYIFGEPIPTYPHIHDGWQGPSCVITGTGYCKIQDHHTCLVPHLIPPHVRRLMAQAKEATDRWRAARLATRQAASLASPAEPIQGSNSLGTRSGDQSSDDPAAPQQSFMVSGVQTSQKAFGSPDDSLSCLIDETFYGQGDDVVPSPNVGAGSSEDGRFRMLEKSDNAVFRAGAQSITENQGHIQEPASNRVDRPSDNSLQNMPNHIGKGKLPDSQDFGTSNGQIHDRSFHHSLVGSRAHSNSVAQSGGVNLRVDGQCLGFFDIDSGSNMSNHPGAGSLRGAYAAERLGRIDKFANRGTGGFNSGFNDGGSFVAASGPIPSVGNLSDPRASSQRPYPTLSGGAVVVGGLRGESTGGFADRFSSERRLEQQPEDQE